MDRSRVLMLELDGFEPSIAEAMIAAGRLPNFARLAREGASLRLDHGAARRTGLAGEHVSTGLAPDDAQRWSALDFDPVRYRALQWSTRLPPFAARLAVRTVVFDPPYFELARASKVRGAVAWGAHDPGVRPASRPATLADEIRARFGPYPATPWIYGFVWPSATRAGAMADALAAAVRTRAQIVDWLLAERLPDWELALVSVSEPHSAIEALWHGVDASHPLHGLPSSAAARRGIESVYEETDGMIGRLRERLDARLVVFSIHGMGPNHADAASMLLLPELLYRDQFGEPLYREVARPTTADGVPLLGEQEAWASAMAQGYPPEPHDPVVAPGDPLWRRLARRLRHGRYGPEARTVAWMPANRYRHAWRRMRAFALPSYYDGRVRVNLVGREAEGMVSPADYAAELERIETLLLECRDPLTGEPVVESFTRWRGADPRRLAPSEVDLIVQWRNRTLGFEHPRIGRIGPLPYRRTGAHTGGHGIAWFDDPTLVPGDHGVTSAFDVVPTVVEMLGLAPQPRLSGASRYRDLRRPPSSGAGLPR